MRRELDGAIWIGNANGCCGETLVADIGGDSTKMSGAAAIGNGNGIGRNIIGLGGGGYKQQTLRLSSLVGWLWFPREAGFLW